MTYVPAVALPRSQGDRQGNRKAEAVPGHPSSTHLREFGTALCVCPLERRCSWDCYCGSYYILKTYADVGGRNDLRSQRLGR